MKQTEFMILQETEYVKERAFDQEVTDMLSEGWQIFSSGVCGSRHWVHLVKTK